MIPSDEFKKKNFTSHGPIEVYPEEKFSYRYPEGYTKKQNNTELRNKMSNLTYDVRDFVNNSRGTNAPKITITELLGRQCDIDYETYKRYIAGKGHMSRVFLAKYCIGLQLDIDQANQLFELHSGKLNDSNDFDFAVICALKSEKKDTIEEFFDDLEKHEVKWGN